MKMDDLVVPLFLETPIYHSLISLSLGPYLHLSGDVDLAPTTARPTIVEPASPLQKDGSGRLDFEELVKVWMAEEPRTFCEYFGTNP